MRQTIWLAIVFSLGCASLPPKPKGDLCTLDVPRQLGRCAPIAGATSTRDMELKRMEALIRSSPRMSYVPIGEMDHYVAFSPETWANVTIYIQELKRIAQQSCQ